MIKVIEKQIMVKEISEVICDVCGKVVNENAFEEYVNINHSGGYGSLIGDGNILDMQICEPCFIIKFSDYIDKCINRYEDNYEL